MAEFNIPGIDTLKNMIQNLGEDVGEMKSSQKELRVEVKEMILEIKKKMQEIEFQVNTSGKDIARLETGFSGSQKDMDSMKAFIWKTMAGVGGAVIVVGGAIAAYLKGG